MSVRIFFYLFLVLLQFILGNSGKVESAKKESSSKGKVQSTKPTFAVLVITFAGVHSLLSYFDVCFIR